MTLAALLSAALAGGSAPGVVTAEFLFETAPFAQCHASTIADTGAGLVAAWFGGTREGNPDVGIWVSRNERMQCLLPERHNERRFFASA